jgi:murein DD-endopeptidase MepM/ murein hydrolase activator NlpD
VVVTLSAQEYIKQELDAGRLTLAHIEAAIRYFQLFKLDLNPGDKDYDGKPGPVTRAALEAGFQSLFKKPEPPPAPDPRTVAPFLSCPLPLLKGSLSPQVRKPQITSQFRKPDRPDHDGCDFFYRWEPGDQPAFVGDGGCEGKDLNGNPKWVVPYGTWALAAAPGVVQSVGPSPTGFRVWVDHGNGLRSGYFHLSSTPRLPGDHVSTGASIGLVGDNPKDQDGRHLHFEVSLVEKYEPLDPEKYLVKW